MNILKISVTPDEITINPAVLAKLMGVDPYNIPEPYSSIINTELEMLPHYDQICGGLRVINKVNLDMEKNELIIEKNIFNPGRQVISYLKNSERLAIFLCTAGEHVSLRSKKLMKSGQLLEAYVCDLIGSVIVEEAMSFIHNNFINKLQQTGESTTNRYSPGYCDWNVNEQHKLFKFFPSGFCGIHLSETALMHPIKSVSGIFGIGKNVVFHKYVCNACSNVNCIYRNLKYTI